MRAFADTPANNLHFFNIFSLKVRGTKAGTVSTTFKLNFLATSYPNLLAPIFGTDNPPVAIINELLVYVFKLSLSSANI